MTGIEMTATVWGNQAEMGRSKQMIELSGK